MRRGQDSKMKDLNRKAFVGMLELLIVLAAALFLPAWTIDYWQAWMFLVVFFVPVLAITIYLMRKDPGLLERRVNAGPGAETRKSQQVIQLVASLAFIALFIVPGLDHRLSWSLVPLFAVAAGDIIVVLGLLIVFLVFKENSFTSAAIEVGTEQKVISTGPYAFVRHPMYIGALVMLLGVSPALGSWWGLFAVIPLALVIVLRLLDEERFLAKNLAGYSDYQDRVRYHLLPRIW